MTALTQPRTVPTVTPRLVRGATVWTFIVTCPYCGKRHTHGGGPVTGNWRAYLGHRVSHCRHTGGYMLGEPQTLEAVK